jgi:hypothetical protein
MGLTIYVKNNYDKTKINCTYNEWNIFRKSIIKSFISYLEEQIILDKYKSISTKDDINDFISHYYKTINYDNINFDNFNKIFDNSYINLFILYNYYGFYIFITKEDNYSFFSVGNSYDMLTFFNLIESYVEKSHEEMFNTLNLLLTISYENKDNIYIK